MPFAWRVAARSAMASILGGPALRACFSQRVGHSFFRVAFRLCLRASCLQEPEMNQRSHRSRTLPVRSAGRTGTRSRPCLLRRLIPVVCRFRRQRRTIRHRAAWRISPRRSACRVRVNSVGGSNCRSKRLHSADLETKNVHAARRLFRGARLVLVPPSGRGLCMAIVGPILRNVYRPIQH